MEEHIQLELSAVAEAAARVGRILQDEGWSEEAAGGAQVALMEHGTNVIRHGRAPAGSAIAFRMRLTGPVCRMICCDLGREWDPAEQLAAEQLQPMDRESGRGLSIIHAVSLHVEFFRRENNNIAFFAIPRQDIARNTGRCGP